MKIKCVVLVFLFLFGFLVLFSNLQAAEPLPDTGMTKFYNISGEISEPAPGDDFYGQDANYTRARFSYRPK